VCTTGGPALRLIVGYSTSWLGKLTSKRRVSQWVVTLVYVCTLLCPSLQICAACVSLDSLNGCPRQGSHFSTISGGLNAPDSPPSNLPCVRDDRTKDSLRPFRRAYGAYLVNSPVEVNGTCRLDAFSDSLTSRPLLFHNTERCAPIALFYIPN
jgi:hypothetical protein